MLPIAIFSMISALVLYSVGVWSEKFAGWLKPWHLVCFFAGLVFDTTGTTIMSEIARQFQFNLHGITGAAAIILMLAHAAWAAVVLWIKRDGLRASFHRLSLFVWAVWLVPFFSGAMMAMHH
ncbi:MAG TPA: HsmA family protein [Anaerolineaceae bacterium]